MTVLGFMNYASHDPGACIVTDKNGKLEYKTISDERLSRVKNSYFFPIRSIKYCMDYFNIKSFDEIDLIVTDFGFEQQLTDTTKHYRKLEADYLKTKLNFDLDKLVYIDSHHLAHATTAFYPSGFNEAAVLVIDGFGSNVETNSLYKANYKDGLKLLDKASGQGIGIVYTAVTTDILNFGVGEEGKTMGLAPVGRNVEGEKILNFNSAFDGIVTDYSEFIDRAPYSKLKQNVEACKNRKDVTNDFYSKVAFELQKETEDAIIHLANYAYEQTKSKNLCFAGGVALNCVANALILDNTPFENIFIQPAASDTGIPFGLALYGYSLHKYPKIDYMDPYVGNTYSPDLIKDLLSKFNIEHKKSDYKEVAKLLTQENIIGWHVDGSEFGPRALGHRSIIADPRFLKTKDLINSKVKHREMYRPFAPSILKEKASEWFIMNTDSPYMLLAPMTHKDKQDKVPAIVHVDGTARVQTVSEDNIKYYNLIKEFDSLTNVPIVLNTSFNDNGEPIVETPLDSLLCFLRTNIDYLYLDGYLIEKNKVNNIENLIYQLEEFRKEKLRLSYAEGLNTITKNYSTSELKAFINAYSGVHDYYKNIHTNVYLRNAINKNVNACKYFITDNYHLDIIKKFMYEEYNKILHKIIIVDDIYSNIDSLKSNSFVLLYNLSLYVNDESIFNFYKDRSLIKLVEPYNTDYIEDNNLELSNEYISSKDWNEFYEKVCN